MKNSLEAPPTIVQPKPSVNSFSKYHSTWIIMLLVLLVMLVSVAAIFGYTRFHHSQQLEPIIIYETESKSPKEDTIDNTGDSANFPVADDDNSTSYSVYDYEGVRYINITCTQQRQALDEVSVVISKIYNTNTTEGFSPVSLILKFCIFENATLTRKLLKTLADRNISVKNFSIYSGSLKAIARDAFYDVRTQLRTLSSHNTDLLFVPKESFFGINNLSSLSIVGHTISALKSFDFSELSSLQDLEISSGNLEYIDNDAFENLQALVKLNLANNEIDNNALINQPLAKIKGLKTLNLSNNRLTHLLQGMLPPSLQVLNLTHNMLQLIGERTFWNTPDLQSIFIRGNLLTTLPEDLFSISLSHRPQPYTVESYDNPWICDCQLRWFKEYLQAKGILQESKAKCHNYLDAPLFYQINFCEEISSTSSVQQTKDELSSTVTTGINQVTDETSSTVTFQETTEESPSTVVTRESSEFTMTTIRTEVSSMLDLCPCPQTDTEEKLEKLLWSGTPAILSFFLGVIVTACILKMRSRTLVRRPQFGKPVTRRCTPCGPPVLPRPKPPKKVSGILGRLPPVKIREIEMILQQHTHWNKPEHHLRINDRSSDSSEESRRTSTISAVSSDIYLMLEEDSHRLSVSSLRSLQSESPTSLENDCGLERYEDEHVFNTVNDPIADFPSRKSSAVIDDQKPYGDPIVNLFPKDPCLARTNQELTADSIKNFSQRKYSTGKEDPRRPVDTIINLLPRKYSLGWENHKPPYDPIISYPRRKYSILREDQKPPIGYFSSEKDSCLDVPEITVSDGDPTGVSGLPSLPGTPDFSHLHPRRISLAHRNTFVS